MDAFMRSNYMAIEMPTFWSSQVLHDLESPSAIEDYMSEEQRQGFHQQAMAIFEEYEDSLVDMGLTLDDLYGLNLDALNGLLGSIAGAKTGAEGHFGMEFFFFNQSRLAIFRRPIPLLYIEDYTATTERVRNMSPQLRLRYFELGLSMGITAHTEAMIESMRAWRRGDDNAVLAMINQTFDDLGCDELIAEWRYILLESRDPRMADRASEFMAEGKKVFFMVGAAHLLGEGNVIDLLVQRGYDAVRIQ